MAATGAYKNSGSWQFIAAGGGTYPIPKVKNWSLARNISRIREGADYDHFVTLNACDFEDPVVTLSTIGPFALASLSPLVFGTLSGTIHDAYNGAVSGGGGKQIQLANAALMTDDMGGAYRAYATDSIAFCGTSPDGITSPLSISAL